MKGYKAVWNARVVPCATLEDLAAELVRCAKAKGRNFSAVAKTSHTQERPLTRSENRRVVDLAVAAF